MGLELSRDAVSRALSEAIHIEAYRQACDELQTLIDVAEWDEETRVAKDIPDLEVCRRVSPIARNPIFPPLWRLSAQRTMLPQELQDEVGKWKRWIKDVKTGHHDEYLHNLLLHDASNFLHYHWSYLHGNAVASLEKDVNWTKKAEFQELRQTILCLPEPEVIEIPIDILETKKTLSSETLDETVRMVTRILELTKAWNRHTKGSYKLPDYRSNYFLSIDEMKAQTEASWLTEFLSWADRCVDLGFGFYLDY